MSNTVNGEVVVTTEAGAGGGSTSANQTNGTQRTKITDGTNNVDVSNVGGLYALKVDVVSSTDDAVQYAEDTASAPGESVIMAGVVRNDTRGTLVDANGDRTELQVDGQGELRVTDDDANTSLASLLLELRLLNGAMAMQTDEASATVTYQGWAEPGTLTSAGAWRIKRITETSADFALVFADGNRNFDNIWDNRASLSYS